MSTTEVKASSRLREKANERISAEATQKLVAWVVLTYVHLWVLEGAIRKWIPGSSQPMYFLRDGLLVAGFALLVVLAARSVRKPFLLELAVGGFIVFALVQTLATAQPVAVTVVGLRSYLAPLLFIALMWRYGTRALSHRIAVVMVVYLVIETALAVLQVMSSDSSFVNREIGGEDAHFVNFGVVRASGTFTAPIGLSLFTSLALAAVLALAVTADSTRARLKLLPAMLAGVVIVAISGSRGTVLLAVFVLAVFAWQALVTNSRASKTTLNRVFFTMIAAGIGVTFLFRDPLDSFVKRFENAEESESSGNRLWEQTFGFLWAPLEPLGNGVGANSQAGIQVGSQYPWVEIEAIKWVSELGLVGWAMGIGRLLLVAALLFWLFARPSRLTPLGNMIAAAFVPTYAYGPISHTPSTQAFFAVAVGILVLEVRSLRTEQEPTSSFRRKAAHGIDYP